MPVFALGRSANVYVIYKDEITAEAVQSPLFSYVTFAKVVKITGITLQIIEILPCYHNMAGHKYMNHTSFVHTFMGCYVLLKII